MHKMCNQDDNIDLNFGTGSTSGLSSRGSHVGLKAPPLSSIPNSQKTSLVVPIKRICALIYSFPRKHIKVKTSNHQRLPAHASVNDVNVSVKHNAVNNSNVSKRSQVPKARVVNPEGNLVSAEVSLPRSPIIPELDEEDGQADDDLIDVDAWQAENDLTDFYARHSA